MAKNANGRGTIYQRSNGLWEGKITTGIDPLTKKQKRRSVYGKSQKEVKKNLDGIINDLDNDIYIEPSKMTVSQWLTIWVEDFLERVKPNTRLRYEAICEAHITPALGAITLTALTPHAVQKFVNILTREKKRAPKTVANIHGVLHKALQVAVTMGYLKTNPADRSILPLPVTPEIKPYDNDGARAFLQAIKGDSFEHLFFLALSTGIRQGEIIGLTWDRVDFDRGTIRVDRQLQRDRRTGAFDFTSTKNAKSRLITPPEQALAALRDQKRRQAAHRLAAGKLWQAKGFVFANEIGGYTSPTTLYKHFKRITAAIGLPDRRFHDLRHTYATLALANGVGVKDVQETLGHFSAAFTLDVYGHVTESVRRDNAAKIDRFLIDLMS